MFESDGKLWLVGVIAAIAGAALLHWFAGFRSPDARAMSASSLGASTQNDEVIPQTMAPLHESTAPQPRALAHVYECDGPQGRVLSSRPCGRDARVIEVAPPNRMDAQDTSRLYRPEPRKAWGSYEPTPSEPYVKSNVCDEIDHEIDAINARMRRGYKAWEGERFRDRLRVLKEERYDSGCFRR